MIRVSRYDVSALPENHDDAFLYQISLVQIEYVGYEVEGERMWRVFTRGIEYNRAGETDLKDSLSRGYYPEWRFDLMDAIAIAKKVSQSLTNSWRESNPPEEPITDGVPT